MFLTAIFFIIPIVSEANYVPMKIALFILQIWDKSIFITT
jgi:hypothetical protein